MQKAALVLVAPLTVKSATASEVCAAKIQFTSLGRDASNGGRYAPWTGWSLLSLLRWFWKRSHMLCHPLFATDTAEIRYRPV